MPHLVSISAATLPTPPIPTTATWIERDVSEFQPVHALSYDLPTYLPTYLPSN